MNKTSAINDEISAIRASFPSEPTPQDPKELANVRPRRMVLTLWSMNRSIKAWLDTLTQDPRVTYLIVGPKDLAPKTEREHWHMLVCFKDSTRATTILNMVDKNSRKDVWIDPRPLFSMDGYIKYIMQPGGEPELEYGEPPVDGRPDVKSSDMSGLAEMVDAFGLDRTRDDKGLSYTAWKYLRIKLAKSQIKRFERLENIKDWVRETLGDDLFAPFTPNLNFTSDMEAAFLMRDFYVIGDDYDGLAMFNAQCVGSVGSGKTLMTRMFGIWLAGLNLYLYPGIEREVDGLVFAKTSQWYDQFDQAFVITQEIAAPDFAVDMREFFATTDIFEQIGQYKGGSVQVNSVSTLIAADVPIWEYAKDETSAEQVRRRVPFVIDMDCLHANRDRHVTDGAGTCEYEGSICCANGTIAIVARMIYKQRVEKYLQRSIVDHRAFQRKADERRKYAEFRKAQIKRGPEAVKRRYAALDQRVE